MRYEKSLQQEKRKETDYKDNLNKTMSRFEDDYNSYQ